MDNKNALKLLNEIWKNTRYWVPNTKDKKILEEIDWKVRIDKAPNINDEETKELLRMYDLMKEASA